MSEAPRPGAATHFGVRPVGPTGFGWTYLIAERLVSGLAAAGRDHRVRCGMSRPPASVRRASPETR
jgi:hypothetical protein